jgi:acetoin:2,6-dichlorophenolindophenol oxidoreductase subunit beta
MRVAKVTFLDAIRDAMREEMRRDPRVFLMGEDVVHNVYGSSGGLAAEFGLERVIDVPLSEAGFVGAAGGAAMVGMRPVVDVTIAPFLYPAMDQIVSIIAKSRYLYGGQTEVPVVIRVCMLYNVNNAAQHSDRPYPTFMGIPGLKIIAPSNPRDMKGLMKAAIRDNDPVLSFEDGNLWMTSAEIPEEDFVVPLGKAAVVQEGKDVTLFAIAGSVPLALKAAQEVAGDGVSVELIDPRTIKPLDIATVLASVKKTGRFIAVDPAHKSCSIASEIAATVAEQGFWDLKAPIVRVTTPDIPIPFASSMERDLYPTTARIVAAIRATMAA